MLTTFGDVRIEQDNVVIQGERGGLVIQFDSSQVQARVDLVANVPLTDGLRDVRRLIFEWPQPQQAGTIRLAITPEARS